MAASWSLIAERHDVLAKLDAERRRSLPDSAPTGARTIWKPANRSASKTNFGDGPGESVTSPEALPQMDSPRCSQCGTDMVLHKVQNHPKQLDANVKTYRCKRCGLEEMVPSPFD